MASGAAARAAAARARFFPLLVPLVLALVLAFIKPVSAAAASTADDDATDSGGGQASGRYPLMARLAPCLPLPVNSNCSQVPDTLHRNFLTCTHVSFQPGGYGQGARSARLAYEVEADEEEDGGAGRDGGLTMVLLVGSTLWFEDQAAMYAFLQPRLQAALQASHGYDPTLQGPCMGGRQADGPAAIDGEVVAIGRRRRQRRRSLRGLERQQLQQLQEEQEGAAGGDGVVVPGSLKEGFPSCADVLAAFNAAGRGLGEATESFAYLYTCNVTSATAYPQPSDEGSDPSPQLLAFDDLRPADYPFTYFVFINAARGDDDADPSSSSPERQQQQAAAALGTAATNRAAVNQTVRYAATFSPTYSPAPARLPQPAFALLLFLCAVALVGMSAYVSAPVLDKIAGTRCGKWCLQARG